MFLVRVVDGGWCFCVDGVISLCGLDDSLSTCKMLVHRKRCAMLPAYSMSFGRLLAIVCFCVVAISGFCLSCCHARAVAVTPETLMRRWALRKTMWDTNIFFLFYNER